MENQDGDIDYDNIIETLLSTFGDVLSRDCMFAIVESCGGDLDESANAVINIMMDGNLPPTTTSESTNNIVQENVTVNHVNTNQQNLPTYNVLNESQPNNPSTSSLVVVPANSNHFKSYAGVSKNIVQLTQKNSNTRVSSTRISNKSQNIWTDQIKQIISHHQNGARVLVIMRGLPGSGKSYLARKIVDAMFSEQSQKNYTAHIFSTDDYFMRNNHYEFDKSKLSEYHERNERKTRNCMIQGVSPVIIDNTNVELWEMKPYVSEGVKNGYIVEVVEPNTSWARNPKQLCKNTLHNVPFHSIQRKLEIYQNGVTGDYLISYFRYQYPPNMTPPVLRLIPQFVKIMPEKTMHIISENDKSIEICENIQSNNLTTNEHSPSLCYSDVPIDVSPFKVPQEVAQESIIEKSDQSQNSDMDDNAAVTDLEKDMRFTEIIKSLEEIEKIEEEWDNGDDWNDEARNTVKNSKTVDFADSKPQRKEWPRSSLPQKNLSPVEDCHSDWRKISMFLPSWGESSQSPVDIKPVTEKKSSATCIEIGDTEISDFKNPLKIITATPRDINEFYVEMKTNKIPEKWMLDKSTSTSNHQILTDTQRCENEEHHFNSFRKLFKNIPRADLRDIFDNCCGDVNWAVDIVLDGMENQQLVSIESDNVSDTEEEEVQNENLCQCLSAYDILPDHNEASPQPIESEQLLNKMSSPAINIKKGKKESVVSDESMQLKRQIEQNVVISDNHYSQHCLKIRKIRYGENNGGDNKDNENVDNNADNTNKPLDANVPSTSGLLQPPVNEDKIVCVSNEDNSDTNDDELVEDDNAEITVNINVGNEFIQQLDQLFGRFGIKYPSSIMPKLSIRQSLLNEINALWIESLMHQLEENAKQTDLMIKQDEEFARQLALKENELLIQGKEPEIPDFKEIMDMDYAIFLYHKDVEEWRNKEPNDLAAKLTREKLYNLFPDIAPDILSQLLMAHNNNFQLTVEALLMSTGRFEILAQQNGVSKFVMQKEIERQEKILERERQALSEVEWPLLPTLENVDMETVQRYRDQADKHLQSRNMNYQKAQDYIRRGMTQVATYYSDFANYHTMKYEQSNSMAAASLMQLHATKCPNNATIDLHYLRVREARESLDLFLDTHIQKLREMQDRNGIKFHTLFFITGRGLHSNGRPRVKPAVIKRLRERGLNFCERNPGLLTAKVCADDKLSYQVA
ncbi:unnamed protein product [Euphydryas editha]|uniref:Smr domain-containing protein n=1 Tax=Euphydryas editha TaxID=104508 RepID=A0AAU9TG47_EUPED|nr:unnamed protein product [Euphydryas editha]